MKSPVGPVNFSRLSLLAGLLLGFAALRCGAQELEPRRWSHLPTGIDFVGGGYAYTTGDIAFDPVLQIEEARLEVGSSAFKYIRTFGFLKQSARFDFLQAY